MLNYWNDILENLKKDPRKEQFYFIHNKQQFEVPFSYAYLEKTFGNNIHEKGIIEITASSSEYSRPEKVIDYDWKDTWSSDNNKLNWWKIDFKENVLLSGYSLKTRNKDINTYHLKNWVIEGSIDNENWVEIDRQEDNYDLNGPSYQKYFPISSSNNHEFRYFRLKNIGRNHYGDLNHLNYYYMQFTNIEFFGIIDETSLFTESDDC